MKKVLLVVGLVVLFFAQSSYADVKKGYKSGVTWKYIIGYDFGGDVHIKHKNSIDKKIRISTRYTHDTPGDNHCFDFSSKTYFNVDLCEEVKLQGHTRIKKEPENTRRVKEFVKRIAQDICEDPILEYSKPIEKGNILVAGNFSFKIKCPMAMANKKRIEEEKKLAQQIQEQEQEQVMTKNKEQELLASVNAKRELCSSMDFQNGTDGMANCILQLMLAENKKNEQQQVIITSGNDGLADAMDEQTRILSKQLRIQKIQHSRENLRRFNHMMNTGTIPTW